MGTCLNMRGSISVGNGRFGGARDRGVVFGRDRQMALGRGGGGVLTTDAPHTGEDRPS
jgi:hypothetical protein